MRSRERPPSRPPAGSAGSWPVGRASRRADELAVPYPRRHPRGGLVAEHQTDRQLHPAAADRVVLRSRAGAVYLLSRSMDTVPVGTAYVVFTGIGAVGAISLGIAVHGDPVTPGRLVAAALIVAGIVVARLTSPA